MNKLVKLSVAQVTYNYYLGWKSELFQLTESIFFTFLRSQCRNIKNVFVLPSTDVTFSFCQTYIAQYSHWLDSFISSIVRSIMRYSYTVIFILPLQKRNFWEEKKIGFGFKRYFFFLQKFLWFSLWWVTHWGVNIYILFSRFF